MPYRTPGERPHGQRWGATLWTRIATSLERERRRMQRWRVADADPAQCAERMQRDAAMLYPMRCTCGQHQSACA